MISDSMTAYSTAVGPSSLFKNRFNFVANWFIPLTPTALVLQKVRVGRNDLVWPGAKGFVSAGRYPRG